MFIRENNNGRKQGTDCDDSQSVLYDGEREDYSNSREFIIRLITFREEVRSPVIRKYN